MIQMVHPRILIVDDDQELLNLLKHLFTREGYEVTLALNGQEALERLHKAENLPNSILLDLRMPIMDGWTFRKKQKADPKYAKIPVIVITSVKDFEKDLTSIDAAAFFKKPIQQDLLIATVKRHS